MDLFTLFIYLLIPGAFLLVLYFVMRAAVRTVIDEKLEEIKKVIQNANDSEERIRNKQY